MCERLSWGIRLMQEADRSFLLTLWEKAVRATHFFFTEKDITFYRECIKMYYLREAQTVVAVETYSDKGQIVGFLEGENLAFSLLLGEKIHLYRAIDTQGHRFNPENSRTMGQKLARGDTCLFSDAEQFAGKVTMLFVAPGYYRRGVGGALMHCVFDISRHVHVDVNEQNNQALSFYLKQGFLVAGRSKVDGQGSLFPLLHLCRYLDRRQVV